MSRTLEMVKRIAELDLMHRKGWRPSEQATVAGIGLDLAAEVNELNDALEVELGMRAFREGEDRSEAIAQIKQELGDVLAVTMQIARRLGMTFEELDAIAVAKLRKRFIGAEEIIL